MQAKELGESKESREPREKPRKKPRKLRKPTEPRGPRESGSPGNGLRSRRMDLGRSDVKFCCKIENRRNNGYFT